MNNEALLNLIASQLLPLGWVVPENLSRDDAARLRLARQLADHEYHHPECQAADASEKQRSFCFDHDGVTSKSVLVVHGFTACPYEMRELGGVLHSLGYNVFGVRLAGHGTDVKDFARYTGSDWEGSVRRGLAIAALLGNEVIVMGESMGGALAVLLAAEFPLLVNRVVLCAPCFRIANPFAWMMTFPLVRRFMPFTDMGPMPDWMRPYWYSVIPTSAIAELVYIARNARKVAGRMNIPLLMIQAKNDKMVQCRGTVEFFRGLRHLPDADKQLKFLAHGHHNLTIDLNPEKKQVFQWIEEFVESPVP